MRMVQQGHYCGLSLRLWPKVELKSQRERITSLEILWQQQKTPFTLLKQLLVRLLQGLVLLLKVHGVFFLEAKEGAEGDGETGGTATYVVSAIKEVKKEFVDGAYQIAVTLYDQAEPVIYEMKEKMVTYSGKALEEWGEEIQGIYNAVTATETGVN